MAYGITGEKLFAWVKIARFQFYPMTWLAYSLGAVAQSVVSGRFSIRIYLLGYLVLFLIEFCTILANEYFDYESDRQNKNFSTFTGGTRVLVEEKLSFREVRTGILIGLAMIPVPGYLLIRSAEKEGSPSAFLFLLILGLFLGLGYTVPPLKFSYRGAGEIVVGFTHSAYVILCGFVFQGGYWKDPVPWLLSVPLFFAVLAANTLAGIPDRHADRAVLKRSVAVIFGARPAVLFAICFVCAAFLSGALLGYLRLFPVSLSYWGLLVLPHCLLLLWSLFRFLQSDCLDGRINGILGLALSYIIWFGLLPIIAIW
jgi:1,4-dihydroxy-2-naphthoate polyprenyltransferase